MRRVLFNRSLKRIQRDAAAANHKFTSEIHEHFAADLVDRITYIRRKFTRVLELGCHLDGHVLNLLNRRRITDGVELYALCDLSPAMVQRSFGKVKESPPTMSVHPLCVDEESLPFADASFDLILSNLSFHWVNDLERLFKELRRILVPDGVLLGNMVGENTLCELGSTFATAERALDGGVSPHVSPMIDGADVASLLFSAGFALPTVDIDHKVWYFDSGMDLMRYLQNAGESNALLERRALVPYPTFKATAELYHKTYSKTVSKAKRSYSNATQQFAYHGTDRAALPATFEVISFVGWAPDPSQPKPLKRGTPGLSLDQIIKELDKLEEEQEKGAEAGSEPSLSTNPALQPPPPEDSSKPA